MAEIIVGSSWRDKLDALVVRRRDTWLVVVAVGAVVAFALAGWARRPQPQIAPPATAPAPVVVPESEASPAGVLYVHVSGAVRHPGLYELPAGSRVADAIDSAGGTRSKADVGALNLAEVLSDAAKVDVPRKGEQPVASAPAPAPTSTAPQVVDINTADASALETIPGIGPVRAQAILHHRDEVGSFRELHELLEIDGIGPATLESIRPYITL